MSLLTQYKKLKKLQEQEEKANEELAKDLNIILRSLNLVKKYQEVSSIHNISIYCRFFDKDLNHEFAGMSCLQINESSKDPDSEYSRSFILPSFILNDKNYVQRYKDIIKKYHSKSR